MHLDRFAAGLNEQLAVAAEAGGDDARALAERLTAPLDAAVRLMLLDVLAAAAAEITRELAPGSVELRISPGGPEFVVTPPPAEPPRQATAVWAERTGSAEALGTASPPGGPTSGDGGVARVNLRLPEALKARIEQAADQEGLSLNAWLVRMLAAAIGSPETDGRRERRAPRGGQRYAGWGR